MKQHQYWWSVYGSFRPGEEHLPHLGDVFAYYFEMSGMNNQEIAGKVGYTVRFIQLLKNRENVDHPKEVGRRRMLARMFHIPPVLLGLSAVGLEQSDAQPVLPPASMQRYENLLAMCWELYYTSNIGKAEESITATLAELGEATNLASGVKRDQLDYMRCRFFQVASVVSRDQRKYPEALASMNQAAALAEKLKTSELVASSLLRRARVYLGAKEYPEAYADAMKMLPYADKCADPLKGKCYQMAGEATSFIAGLDAVLQQKSLGYFNEALKIVRKGNLEPDGSFVRTDLTSILIEKADAQRIFGQPEDALETLAIARKHASPEQHRWLINLATTEINIYLGMGKIDEACHLLQEHWPLVKAVNIPSKSRAMLNFYDQAVLLSPDHPAVLALGHTMGK